MPCVWTTLTIKEVQIAGAHQGMRTEIHDKGGDYAYTPATGQLASISNTEVSLGFAYDGSLRTLESVTGAVSGNISRSYDADFRTTGLAVNGDNNLSFAYDPDSLLIEAGDLGFTRHPANGLISGTSLGRITTAQGYSVSVQPPHLEPQQIRAQTVPRSIARSEGWQTAAANWRTGGRNLMPGKRAD